MVHLAFSLALAARCACHPQVYAVDARRFWLILPHSGPHERWRSMPCDNDPATAMGRPQDIFTTLVARNAINLHAPVSAAGIVTAEDGPDQVQARLQDLLARVAVPT